MKTIEIIVDADGKATVQTRGFAGGECKEASRFVERALGVVVADVPTAEAYLPVTVERRLEQRG
jgi:hypothetical protein